MKNQVIWLYFIYIIFYSLVMTCTKSCLHFYGPDLLCNAHTAWEIHSSHLWTGLIKSYHEEKLRHEISLSLWHVQQSEPFLAKGSAFFIVSKQNQLTLSILYPVTQAHGICKALAIHLRQQYSSTAPLSTIIPSFTVQYEIMHVPSFLSTDLLSDPRCTQNSVQWILL